MLSSFTFFFYKNNVYGLEWDVKPTQEIDLIPGERLFTIFYNNIMLMFIIDIKHPSEEYL